MGFNLAFKALILTLGGREWSAARPGRFTPDKTPQSSLGRRLGGLQNQSGPFGDWKNLLSLPGTSVFQPVA